MKANHIIYNVIALLLAIVLGSCSSEIDNDIEQQEQTTVCASLRISVAGETATLVSSTRAIDDPDHATDHTLDGMDTKISNVWVLQFEGTNDDAKIIGEPDYIEAEDDGDLNGTTQLTQLVGLPTNSTVVLIANTFDPDFKRYLTQNMTLGNLKSQPMHVYDQASALRINGTRDASKQFPEDGDYHLMFNAVIVEHVTNGCTVDCELRRNLARVDVTININNALGLTVNKISLRNVPEKEYYLTAYDHSGHFPADGTFQTIHFNYDALQQPVTHTADKDIYQLRYYTTPNERGIVTENSTDRYKNWQSPADATYLYIEGTYTEDGEEKPISYSFYLGENMQTDFNLKPNHKYAYTFDITNLGDNRTDSRILDDGLKDYTLYSEQANCYILNPPTRFNYVRRYRIPIKRANEFWGDASYGNDPNYVITQKDHWEAFLIWADFKITDPNADGIQKMKLTTFQGYGVESQDGQPTYIEVEIPRGVKGNAVVGVRMTDPVTPTLWSWHLWITDYNPDEIIERNIRPETGTYYYPVTGGSVHRYGGAEWTTGSLKNAFIMDRSMGALDTKYHSDKYGYMAYQYGSKNPVTEYAYKYNAAGDRIYFSTIAYNSALPNNNMVYSTYFPMKFIAHDGTRNCSWTPWATENLNLIWEDPKTNLSMPNNTKSLFDPTPPGWVMPRTTNTWSDFSTSTTNTSGTPRELPSYGTNTSLYYIPTGAGNYDANKIIQYPHMDWLRPGNGSLYDEGGRAQLMWVSESHSAGNGKMMWLRQGNRVYVDYYSKTWGFHIRAIRYLPDE